VKKIFILTGEESGDKLASKVIINLKNIYPNIEYLSVGGNNLKALGIKSIYDLKEITYLGFTSVIFNLLKINKKINNTVETIIKYDPDLLFTVDSPDFTLRVAEKVKRKNSNIKTVHYVAPQVWLWRENRVKNIKKFIDHVLLLFYFEKPFFDKENVSNEFVGHPLLEIKLEDKIDINQIIEKNKAIISIFPGSRKSEVEVLMPILLKFVGLMNEKYNDFIFVFHSTKTFKESIQLHVKSQGLKNCEVISDDIIKSHVLKKSIFAIAKSGTISLEICNAKIPSIILYKMGIINFLIIKMLVKTKFANIINIAAKEEIIPELLQSKCNAQNIFKNVSNYLKNPDKMKSQVYKTQSIIEKLKTNKSSASLVAKSLVTFLDMKLPNLKQ
jgi:lipid-A-disaccharide synthase